MKLTDFKVLSFDCYGTLIDWEYGLVDRARTAGDGRGHRPRAALETFGALEAAQEPKRRLSSIVTFSRAFTPSSPIAGAGRRAKAKHRAFGASIGNWPPFADTTPRRSPT